MSTEQKVRIAIPEIGQFMRNYDNAVLGVGAEPVIVSVRREHSGQSAQQEYLDFSDFRAENYDGLLIPGGGDVDPKRYGQENTGSYGINTALDTLQFCILDQCIKAGVPVMGICRGYQLINIYFGGTLVQDIPTAAAHAKYAAEEPDKVHRSHANHGSWLSHIYGTSFPVNSAHHQAIDRLGQGLVIDSRCADDGVPEAMHHETLPVIGVQWHPERMSFAHRLFDTVDVRDVLEYFLEMCKKRQKARLQEEAARYGQLSVQEDNHAML